MVGRENFSPIPKVNSAIVSMIYNKINIDNHRLTILKNILNIAFSKRRKMMQSIFRKLPSHCPFPLNARPENLTIDNWLFLVDNLIF